jgi:hypothetical protein
MKIYHQFFLYFFFILLNVIVTLESLGFTNSPILVYGNEELKESELNNHKDCNIREKYEFISGLNDTQFVLVGPNSNSMLFDFGCDKKISTIDIVWKNTDQIKYSYTVRVLCSVLSIAREVN